MTGDERENCTETCDAIGEFITVLKIFAISIIKIVTFNMNPKLAEVLLTTL